VIQKVIFLVGSPKYLTGQQNIDDLIQRSSLFQSQCFGLFGFLVDANLDHFDGLNGIIVACAYVGDFHDEIIIINHLAKDRVCRWSRLVKPIQEGVVYNGSEKKVLVLVRPP
jgi:hypothetical protein